MKNNIIPIKNKLTPVRLRLELIDNHLSGYQERMLKRYGESPSGDSIIRDILIPSDMPLHNLHYAIQKLFGWQNSHLRSFYLPKERYKDLTHGTVKGWSQLVGKLFQPPSEAEGDVFWDDDYEKGSFKVWLRKKYTGPYIYGGTMEHPEAARRDVQALLDHFPLLEVRESFRDYMKRKEQDENTEVKIIKKAPLITLTLEEMRASIMLDGGTESLLERLEVNKLIAAQDEEITPGKLFPVSQELIYNYDFGDGWTIKISKYEDCEDLLSDNSIDEYELEEAKDIVLSKHKPVCINKLGLSVFDDVGGLGGFADFLGLIYEGEDKEDSSNARAWAKSLGWNAAKISNRMMI